MTTAARDGGWAESGLFDLPPGRLAAAVTSLEMRVRPAAMAADCPSGVGLEWRRNIDIDHYRALYRHVGEDWLWFSRLRMADAKLRAIIEDPLVEIYAVTSDGAEEGILELDFREASVCEIAFFGLGATLISRGAGRWLMAQTLEIAWSRPIERLWVHTCTWDHPRALAFYRACGFTPFKQQIEIIDDPRLDGTLAATAAGHIPMLAAR